MEDGAFKYQSTPTSVKYHNHKHQLEETLVVENLVLR